MERELLKGGPRLLERKIKGSARLVEPEFKYSFFLRQDYYVIDSTFFDIFQVGIFSIKLYSPKLSFVKNKNNSFLGDIFDETFLPNFFFVKKYN